MSVHLRFISFNCKWLDLSKKVKLIIETSFSSSALYEKKMHCLTFGILSALLIQPFSTFLTITLKILLRVVSKMTFSAILTTTITLEKARRESYLLTTSTHKNTCDHPCWSCPPTGTQRPPQQHTDPNLASFMILCFIMQMQPVLQSSSSGNCDLAWSSLAMEPKPVV